MHFLTKKTLLFIAAYAFAILSLKAEQLVFTEIMYNPAGTKPEYIEIKNITTTPRDIAKWRFSAGLTYEFPDFAPGSPQAHFIGVLESIVVSSADPATTRAAYPWIPAQQRVFGPWTGSLDNGGEQVSLDDKNGVTQVSVTYGDNGRWPKAADGTGHSLMLINQNKDPDDFRNWKVSPSNRGNAAPTPVMVVNYGDVWEWNIPTSDPGTSWRTTTGSWGSGASGSGAGAFGFEPGYAGLNLPVALQTPVGGTNQGVVYLFRKSFTFNGNPLGATLVIDQCVDDGVSYYLNGNLIGSVRHTPGVWDVVASAVPPVNSDASDEQAAVSGPATGLINGTNILSAEVHQFTANSSDMVFAARMNITPGGGVVAATLRLSEVHFNATGDVDWIEIQNFGTSTQSAAGLFLSSKNDFSNKVALSGTIAAGAYQSFAIPNGGFAADNNGNVDLFLSDALNNVLDAADLTHVAGRDSLQAQWPVIPAAKPTWELLKTGADWYSSTTATQNAVNSTSMITTSIVINEIMNDPMSEQDQAEYLELFNNSGVAVSLTGWKIRGGLDFDFPAGTSIPAGGYLVVTSNKAYLQPIFPTATMVGDWTGKLGNKGDYLRLIDQNGNLADEVEYKTRGEWPDISTNKGSSMELVNPNMDNNRGSAWRASDETNKASFATYSVSGTYQKLYNPADPGYSVDQNLDNWASPSEYKEWLFRCVKDAHIIVKNATLQLNGSGPNLFDNPGSFSTNGSSASGWLAQGNHAQTYMSGGDLHIIADGTSNTGANRVEIDCTQINQGSSYTVTFEARWVAGTPRLIGELWDHSFGKAFLIDVPNNLGTPGAVNSRNNGTTPPQVGSVVHSPAVPKANQSVTVTARVYSATSLSTVEVLHRADDINNGNGYSAQTMYDNGTNGDAVSGDGVYTAVISSHQVNNRIVQYYVRATATNGQQALDPQNGDTRPAMWIVDDRTMPNTLRSQRFIMSAYDRNALSMGSTFAQFGYKYPRLSNHYFNMTFIHNESEVYHNGEMRSGGSRWHRSDSANMERAKWKLPTDRTFRKREKSNYDGNIATSPTTGVWSGSGNRMTLYIMYLLGYPAACDEEAAHSVFNADNILIRNDKEITDNDLMARVFKNGGDGELYEVLEYYWIKDNFEDRWNSTETFLYKGTDDPVRYHNTYYCRSRDMAYDYSPITDFLKTINDPGVTQERLDRMMDADISLMMAATRAYCADWDGFPLRGKNGAFYRRPEDNRVMLIHWDSDSAFEMPATRGVDSTTGAMAGWMTYLNRPTSRRLYNYYLTEIVNKFSKNSTRIDSWITAQDNSSPAWTLTQQYYTEWFANREPLILNLINENGNAFSTAYAVNSPGNGSSTGAATVNFSGTAPSSAYRVAIDNHPEGVFTWVNQTTWNLDGIVLKTGSNALAVRMLDKSGAQVGTTINWSITKTGNAAPVMDLNVDPSSYNVTLGEVLTLNAAMSYDPDAGALTFGWSSTPATGFTITAPAAVPANSVREVVFSTPGIYSFTVTGTDVGAAATPITREVAVANAQDFESFTSQTIDTSVWTIGGMENQDNFVASRGYSLYDMPGSLQIQVLDTSAKTLTYGNNQPTLLRNMPASGDCALLTEVTLINRKSGSFFTGLHLETNESEGVVRYAFGLDNGTQISVKRLTSGGITNLNTQTSTGADAKLRIRRIGNSLLFQRRSGGVWTTLHTQPMSGTPSLSKGGVFLATSSAETARVAFDYVMVVNPANVGGSVYNSLRITEMMYNPRNPDEVEYIELKNIGGSTINLNGVNFDKGVTLANIGNVDLAPGAIGVVTSSSAGFNAKYPGITVLAQWTSGNLNNSTERVVLQDAGGNVIHDFIYSDVSPWPSYADGQGGALEVINTSGDYSDPANWRATGAAPGGGTDTDGDGVPDAWEAKFGTSSSDPMAKPRATTSVNGSNQTQISWPGVNGQNYRVEYCDNLGDAWQTLSASVGGVNGTVSFTDPQLPRPTKRFYRIMGL